MVDRIPDFVRKVFAAANSKATIALARQPAAHEAMLDFQVFAALDEVGPCILPEVRGVDLVGG